MERKAPVSPELARLDEDWAAERETLMTRRRGGLVRPIEGDGKLIVALSAALSIAMLVAGIWRIAQPSQGGDPTGVMLVVSAALLGLFGISRGTKEIRRARAYTEAEKRYRKEREQLRGG